MDNQAPVSSPESSPSAQEDKVTRMLDLESTIKRFLSDINKIKEQTKTQRDVYNGAFEQDATYSQEAQKAKEVTRAKNAAKQNIVKTPAVSAVSEKLKELKEELTGLNEALSGYLQEYYRISGNRQIVTDNGEVMEIVITTKLVKKTDD